MSATDSSDGQKLPPSTAAAASGDDAALMNVIDLFGIRYGHANCDPEQPYWIELAVNGHGKTTCYGKTARIAAQRALQKLREWGEFIPSSTGEPSEVPCARCGGRVVEFVVPNDVWNSVVRLDGKEGDDEYLCEACYRNAVTAWVRSSRSSKEAPKQIIDPPGAAVEMFRRKEGRLPNRPGDHLSLTDRLELAAQACHAAHLLSCETTCREAAKALSSAKGGTS